MQSKCKVIAFANQKGGVGKTTTTEHLGIGLARQGKTVLLIDMDPQANLTASLGWKNVDALKKTGSDVLDAIILEKDVSFEDMILHHDEGVDLIPSNIRLADIDQKLTGAFVKEKTLTKGIEDICYIKPSMVIDNKFDLLKHPNISLTKDGSMPAYKHGRIAHMIEDWYDIPLSDNEYELLSDEEMDDYFKKLEETK